MNTQVNKVLDEIRTRMEESWLSEEETDAAGEKHKFSTAGEGGAENLTDVGETFNAYLNDIMNALEDDGWFEDEAFGLLWDVVDELASEGFLPNFPPEDASDKELSTWLGAAKNYGLKGAVMQASAELE